MNRITLDPEQCGGRPCIRGMRTRVKDVLEMLAEGAKPEAILADFPDLELEDIQACIAYAAEKPGAPLTVEHLRQRALHAMREDYLAFLDSSPNVLPMENDERR